MKLVKLITGITIEEVPCASMDSLEVRTFPMERSSVCYHDNVMLATDIKRHIVPIKHWVETKGYVDKSSNRKDGLKFKTEEGYIAVSPEIDNVLGKYIEILNKEVEEISSSRDFIEGKLKTVYEDYTRVRRELTSYKFASLWKRIKYVFTGRVF